MLPLLTQLTYTNLLHTKVALVQLGFLQVARAEPQNMTTNKIKPDCDGKPTDAAVVHRAVGSVVSSKLRTRASIALPPPRLRPLDLHPNHMTRTKLIITVSVSTEDDDYYHFIQAVSLKLPK